MSILNKTPAPENPAQVGMCLLEEKREKSFIKHMHPKMKTRKLLVKEIEQEQSEEDEDRYKPQPYPLRTSVFRQVQSRLFEQMTGYQFIFNFSLTFYNLRIIKSSGQSHIQCHIQDANKYHIEILDQFLHRVFYLARLELSD